MRRTSELPGLYHEIGVEPSVDRSECSLPRMGRLVWHLNAANASRRREGVHVFRGGDHAHSSGPFHG